MRDLHMAFIHFAISSHFQYHEAIPQHNVWLESIYFKINQVIFWIFVVCFLMLYFRMFFSFEVEKN